jgi:hypothetical protein
MVGRKAGCRSAGRLQFTGVSGGWGNNKNSYTSEDTLRVIMKKGETVKLIFEL